MSPLPQVAVWPSSIQCGPQTPTPPPLVSAWPSTVPGALSFACSELSCSRRPEQNNRAVIWGVLCTVRWGTLTGAYILKENWLFLSQKLTISDSSWQQAFCAHVCSPCYDLVWDYRSCACYHTCWEFMNAASCLSVSRRYYSLVFICYLRLLLFFHFLGDPEPLDGRV